MDKTSRFLALDAFRGLTITGMILVNTPGSWSYVYAPLKHAEWHGCTPTDLIFPFFLFVIGTAMWFSFEKFSRKGSPAAIRKILKRTIILFLIGLVLNAFPFNRDFVELRFSGVLQRIAVTYCIASLLCLYLTRTRLFIFSGVILIGYWLLLWGFGGNAPYSLETNLVRSIDLRIFGPKHLWQGMGVPFDPEGILSTLPAVVTVLSGYLSAMLIQSKKNLESAVLKMFLWGTGAILAGLIWAIAFPLNKSLWTSSYVLYTTGIALLVLGCFIWIIDIRKYKRGPFPLIVFGMNSLFVFIMSSFWVKTLIYLIKFSADNGSTINGYNWLYHRLFAPVAGNLNGSLLFAVSHIVFFWLVLLVLYRRNIFIKI